MGTQLGAESSTKDEIDHQNSCPSEHRPLHPSLKNLHQSPDGCYSPTLVQFLTFLLDKAIGIISASLFLNINVCPFDK